MFQTSTLFKNEPVFESKFHKPTNQVLNKHKHDTVQKNTRLVLAFGTVRERNTVICTNKSSACVPQQFEIGLNSFPLSVAGREGEKRAAALILSGSTAAK